MSNELDKNVSKLFKSMHKSVQKMRKKTAIEDVLDSNNTAEMNVDDVVGSKTGTLNKAKKKDLEECECKKGCECEDIAPADDEMEKREVFFKSMIKNFETISSAYLKKQEGETLKDSIIDHAKKDKKIGIPELDAGIADAKGNSRMALPKERVKANKKDGGGSKMATDSEKGGLKAMVNSKKGDNAIKAKRKKDHRNKDVIRPRSVEKLAASEDAKMPSSKDLKYPSKDDIKRAKEQKIPTTDRKGPDARKKVRRKTDQRHPTDVKNPKHPKKKDLEYPKD